MAHVAVHKNGNEGIFLNKPHRGKHHDFWYDDNQVEGEYYDSEIPLPKGTIKKLIGKDLTWEDEPVELKDE